MKLYYHQLSKQALHFCTIPYYRAVVANVRREAVSPAAVAVACRVMKGFQLVHTTTKEAVMHM